MQGKNVTLWIAIAVMLGLALSFITAPARTLAGDNFPIYSGYLSAPAPNAEAVTPNDSTDLTNNSRGLFVGTGGNLVLILTDDSSSVTFKNIADGTVLPLRVKRVLSTGTTATDIVCLY